MTVEVFISYASEDIKWREKLEKHLSSLKRQNFIHAYHDGNIIPGSEMEEEILAHLNSAHIILLLISANYIATDFCYQTELKQAIERHETKLARVIPILLNHADYENAPFARLEPLPSNHKPISKWKGREDEAFLDVVKGIKKAIATLQENTSATQPVPEATPTTPEAPEEPTPTPKETEQPTQIFHIPFQRNDYFTGRQAILTQLHQTFFGKRKTIQPQAIRGLGGVGKTQLAVEYAYRFRGEYHYIFWVKADSHKQLVSGYVDIANLLHLVLREDTDQMLTVAEAKEWLRKHENWLLILDNVEDITVIQKTFLPSGHNGHVLLTTRTPIVGTTIQQRELMEMGQEEGTLFLLRRAKLLDIEAQLEAAAEQNRLEAAEIVKTMGALPLALAQAGAYIEETACGLAGYIERYQKRRKKLLSEQGEVDHEPVATTWSLSFEEIAQDKTAADLLRFCAFLHPDAIPEQLIVDGAKALSIPLQSIEDMFNLDAPVRKLMKYSLVRRNDDGKTLNIHRLVQAVLTDDMDEYMQRLWAERIVRAVNLAFPEPSTQTRQWCQQLLPHAQVCAGLIKQWHIESPEALHLLELAGKYLQQYGQYRDAETFVQQLLDIQEHLYGKEHLDVARTLNTLGELARLQAHFWQAQTLHRRALSIRQQLLDPQHPDMATSLNYLARSYHEIAQYSEAAELYKQALAIREQVLDPLHPDIAHSLNDLAVLYETQGKYEEAMPLHQRALVIREQVLGAEHPDTARSLDNLASFYKLQDKYQEALPFCQRALVIREQVLGAEHPDTAKSLDNLAVLYQNQGKDQEALLLCQRALAICEQVLGPEHPVTALCLHDLSRVYRVQGKMIQAITCAKRSLSIYENFLGAKHPYTASSLYNIALLYDTQKNFKQAELAFQRALSICERSLEPEHPLSLSILRSYARMLRKAKRNTKAAEMEAQAEAIRTKLGLEPEQVESEDSQEGVRDIW